MHGYLSDKRVFYNQLNFFSRNFEVFAYDFKGFGENKGMPFPYSLDDYVKDLGEYFYKKGIKTPSVVAHSFGGRVVLKSAYNDANFFNKIVLTGSAGLKPKSSITKKIKKSAFSILKRFISKEKLKGFYSKDYLMLDEVMKKSFIKIVIFVGIILGVLLLNKHYGWSEYLSDTENLMFLKQVVEENYITALILYIVITIIGCVVLALPGITFAVIAGMIFGPVEGILACLIATTLGAMAAFLTGRFFLKDAVKPMLEKNKVLKKLL